MISFMEDVGLAIIGFFEFVGGIVQLLIETIAWVARGSLRVAHTLQQMSVLGVSSLGIVLVTAAFAGMVLSLELAYQAVKFGFSRWVGAGVSLAMSREFAPIMCAVVFAGRAGSAITAEIASMKVTEQIDALIAMATSPVKYLVVPRFLASVLMMPLLCIFANLAGIFGGELIANLHAGVPPQVYMDSIQDNLLFSDITGGMWKAMVFGGEIATISCYQGLNSSGGAAGVGLSTTASVVYSIVLVFVTNYFMSAILFTS